MITLLFQERPERRKRVNALDCRVSCVNTRENTNEGICLKVQIKATLVARPDWAIPSSHVLLSFFPQCNAYQWPIRPTQTNSGMFITHVIWVNLSQGRSTGGQHILSSNGSVMTSNQKGETAHVFFFFF